MILKYLIQKEWTQIRRNNFVKLLIVMYPVVIMCVAPWITDMGVRNIYVSVVDNDRSSLSSRLVGKIESSTYFKFQGLMPSYAQALKAVERGKTDIVMVIPQQYERDMVCGKAPRVLIAANSVNGTKGGMGTAYLSNIITMTSIDGRSLPSPSLQQITTFRLYNQSESYKVNMIPALMAMVMIMICGFLPALNIVGEKEAGTIEQINVTPVSKTQFIVAKLIPYWCVALIDFTICLLLAWLVYGVVSVGHVGLLYLFAILLAVVFSSIGLIISNYSDSLQQAMLVMWFIMVCMMLLSGVFTPVRSMPDWAQTITYINPVRYYIEVARTVFIRGTGLSGVIFQLVMLVSMASVMASWAVWSYKKNG